MALAPSFFNKFAKNDPILSGRSIWSFRHLELKNPSIISDFRHRSRMVQPAQQFWKDGCNNSRGAEGGEGGGGAEVHLASRI